MWFRRLGNGQEIIALACEGTRSSEARLAIGSRDMTIQNWVIDVQQIKATPLFSINLGRTIPKSLAFADNRTKDLYVFGMYDGKL